MASLTMTNEETAPIMTVSQPNATLYVSNIDWKIKKPLLRRALYSLFSRHGKILQVITLRRDGLRGQAWVVFEDTQSAIAALQAENGFMFFQRPLKVEYARETSDLIAKRDGTYVSKSRQAKRPKTVHHAPPTEQTTTTTTTTPTTAAAIIPQESERPSHILFAQNLPEECTSMMLEMLFRQYAGFKEVRTVDKLAFIEFEDETHATLALQGLNGFKLTTNDILNLTYRKS